jgi:hypothetical protein
MRPCAHNTLCNTLYQLYLRTRTYFLPFFRFISTELPIVGKNGLGGVCAYNRRYAHPFGHGMSTTGETGELVTYMYSYLIPILKLSFVAQESNGKWMLDFLFTS